MEYDYFMCEDKEYCNYLTMEGNFCPFAHNKTEANYHPRVFRVRQCKYEEKGKECKQKEVGPMRHKFDDDKKADEEKRQEIFFIGIAVEIPTEMDIRQRL